MRALCNSFLPALSLACFLLASAVSPGYADTNSVSYTYDDLNRLTQVTYGNGVVITYTYDEVGNRTQIMTAGASAP